MKFGQILITFFAVGSWSCNRQYKKHKSAWRAFLWVSSLPGSHCTCLLTLRGCDGYFYVHRTSCQRLCQKRNLEWLHTAVLGSVTHLFGFSSHHHHQDSKGHPTPLACIESRIFALAAGGEPPCSPQVLRTDDWRVWFQSGQFLLVLCYIALKLLQCVLLYLTG